jgi:hypothetical protein
MMFEFLTEGLRAARRSAQTKTIEQYVQIIFLHILALEVLRRSFDGHFFAARYVARSVHGLRRLRGEHGQNDLSALLLVLYSLSPTEFKKHGSTEAWLTNLRKDKDAFIAEFTRFAKGFRNGDPMSGNRFIIQAQRLLNVNRGELIALGREIRNWENKSSAERLRIIKEIRDEFSRLGFSSDLEVFFKPLNKSLSKDVVKTATNKKDFLKKMLMTFGVSAAATAIIMKILTPRLTNASAPVENRTIGYLNEDSGGGGGDGAGGGGGVGESGSASASISGVAWNLGAAYVPVEKRGKRWIRRYRIIRRPV